MKFPKTKVDRYYESLESGEHLFCNGGIFGGKDAPDPPDYGPLAEASQKQMELAREMGLLQLDWAKEQWGEQKALIDRVFETQLPAMEAQAEAAIRDRQRYEQIYQPIEENLVQEFQDYASPERQALESGRAQAEVARTFDAQRQNAIQNLESYGIDPSQTRSQAIDATMRAQEAATQAAAGNLARRNVEDLGRSLRAEAINIGKGYPSQVAGAYSTALTAGQGAIQGLNQSVNTGTNARNTAPYLQAGNQSLGQWNQALGNQYDAQLGQWKANQQAGQNFWGGVGNLAGMALAPGFTTAGGFGSSMAGSLFADGGAVEGPGGPKDDAIPARLSDGEYVVPAEVVARKGTEFFDKLVDKTRTAIGYQEPPSDQSYTGGGAVRKYMNGGPVLPYGAGGRASIVGDNSTSRYLYQALPTRR